jgi:DNA-binding transcriptional LysR family regulator
LILDACRQRGFVPREAARSSQPDFILALVAAGLGVALLPRLVMADKGDLPVRQVLLEEADLRWRLSVIWRDAAVLSPAANAWLELIGSAAGEPQR